MFIFSLEIFYLLLAFDFSSFISLNKICRLQVTGQCTTPDKLRQKLTSRLTVLLIKLVIKSKQLSRTFFLFSKGVSKSFLSANDL